MGTHQSLDALLKDGRITGEAYLLVKDAIESDARDSGARPLPARPAAERNPTSLLKGVAINYGIQCVVLELYILLAYSFHLGPMLGLYLLLIPVTVALYHIVYLPAGELAYQALGRFTNASRLPVYLTVAWLLLVPMMFLVQPIAD
jgi:hypothetical protein